MVARTTKPVAIASPVSKMYPTSTEHDFRFPRRPAGRDNSQSTNMRASDNGGNEKNAENRLLSSLHELNAGLHGTYASASSVLLGPAEFPLFNGSDGNDGISDGTLGVTKQGEPLASQLWKLYAQCKQHMPNQRRMENMTWRLMSLQMRQQKQEAERPMYDTPC